MSSSSLSSSDEDSSSTSSSESESGESDADTPRAPPSHNDETITTVALAQAAQFLPINAAAKLSLSCFVLSLSVPESVRNISVFTPRLPRGAPAKLRHLIRTANDRKCRLERMVSSVQQNNEHEADMALRLPGICKRFRHLTTLQVTGSRLNKESLNHISSLQSLQRLVLSRSTLLSAELPPSFGQGLSVLESLTLHRVAGLSDITPLQGNALSSLRELDLAETEVADLKALAAAKQLLSLKLSGCKLLRRTKGWLSRLTHLETLHMDGSGITTLACVAHLKALVDLRVDSTMVSSIAPLKAITPSLRCLSLASTPVRFVDSLAGAPSLTHLNLASSAVRSILPMRRCDSLTRLNLARTDLSDDTVLNELLSYCKSLTELRLSGGGLINLTDVAAGRSASDRKAILATTPVIIKLQSIFRDRYRRRRKELEEQNDGLSSGSSSSSDEDESEADGDDGDYDDYDDGGNYYDAADEGGDDY